MTDSQTESLPIFLETTIQIDRIIGTQEDRDRIRHNLNGRRVATSGHVLGEFNKTLVQDAITFRNLIISSQDVGEAVLRLRKYVRGRKYERTVSLLMRLGFDNDKQNTIERLENFIEWQAYDHFWRFVDRTYSSDEVGCILQLWKPERNENGDYETTGLKCLKNDPPPCTVLDFIERHRSVIDTFVTTSRSSSRQNVCAAGEALGNILNGSDVPYGQRSNCYTISDTMIVLESHPDAEIYSMDGDIMNICELLGKPKYTENPY